MKPILFRNPANLLQAFTLKSFFSSIKEPYFALAILSFIFASVLFCKEWFSFFSYKEEVVHPVKPSVTVNTNNTINLQSAVFGTPLFGAYVPAASANTASIKQSLLDFVVVGILLAEKNDESQAILRQANGDEKMYLINDTLPGGAIVKQISAREVVIFYQGELERLILPTDKLVFDGPPKPLSKDF